MHIHLRPAALVTSMLLLFLARPAAGQKADTLYLRNGDRIVGEVASLAQGLLQYKTDNVGTINVKWDRVVQLTSRLYFEVEMESGRRYFGTLPRIDSTGVLAVALDRVDVIPLDEIVAITRIKRASFFDRIDGYLDLGFSYAKSNKTFQLTSSLEATYRERNWSVQLKGDLFTQQQNDADPTRRWSIQPSAQRQMARRWLAYAQGQIQHNEELGLDLRTLLSPGAGRAFVQTNTHEFSGFAGLAAQREWYVDTTQTSGQLATTNLEGSFLGQYRAYRYDHPELDVSASLYLYPSLSDLGRVRLEGDARIRYELLKDFYLTLALQNSFDSRPPSADTPKSDFTTTLSISWKF